MDGESSTPKGWYLATDGGALYERRTKAGRQSITHSQAKYVLGQDGYAEPLFSGTDLAVVVKRADEYAGLEYLKVNDMTPEEFADEIYNQVLLSFGGFLDGEGRPEKARSRLGHIDVMLFDLRSRLLDLAPESFESKIERVCEDARQGIYNAYQAIRLNEFKVARNCAAFAATAVGECANDIDDAEKTPNDDKSSN